MAKSKGPPEKKEKYKYPSRFGSHSSMINYDETTKLNDIDRIVLTDEFGDYITYRENIDRPETDQNRCRSSRLGKLYERTEKKD
jgi:hypothetical protein